MLKRSEIVTSMSFVNMLWRSASALPKQPKSSIYINLNFIHGVKNISMRCPLLRVSYINELKLKILFANSLGRLKLWPLFKSRDTFCWALVVKYVFIQRHQTDER